MAAVPAKSGESESWLESPCSDDAGGGDGAGSDDDNMIILIVVSVADGVSCGAARADGGPKTPSCHH